MPSTTRQGPPAAETAAGSLRHCVPPRPQAPRASAAQRVKEDTGKAEGRRASSVHTQTSPVTFAHEAATSLHLLTSPFLPLTPLLPAAGSPWAVCMLWASSESAFRELGCNEEGGKEPVSEVSRARGITSTVNDENETQNYSRPRNHLNDERRSSELSFES